VALQSQTPNQLQEVLGILRRRTWQVLLPAALIVALGIAIAQLLPRMYSVRTQIIVRESTGPISGGQVFQRDITSAATEILAPDLVKDVLASLEWPDYVSATPLEKQLYLMRVMANLKKPNISAAKNFQGSSQILIIYSGPDPQRAANFLNTLRDRYIENVKARVRGDALAFCNKLQELASEKDKKYREVEKRKSELQKKHRISATQGSVGKGNTRQEDPTFVQLSQAKVDLSQVESNLKNERLLLEMAQKLCADEDPMVPQTVPPAVAASTDQEIVTLTTQIRDKRAQQAPYRPPSIHYRKLESEIALLEKQLGELKGLSGSLPAQEQRWVPNVRRGQLLDQIKSHEAAIAQAEVKQRTLNSEIAELEDRHDQLQNVYRQIAELNVESDQAQKAFQEADDLYQRQKDVCEMLKDAEADPYDVVEVATAPPEPTSPNVPMIIGFSIVLGLGAGLGSAFAAEFMRNSYRSVGDIARSMAVPVLGAINSIVTPVEARRTMLRRSMVGASTLVMICSILWITWAYKTKPRLLGPGLYQLIEDLRERFR
jgi:protein tyrosine kinase modulator